MFYTNTSRIVWRGKQKASAAAGDVSSRACGRFGVCGVWLCVCVCVGVRVRMCVRAHVFA